MMHAASQLFANLFVPGAVSCSLTPTIPCDFFPFNFLRNESNLRHFWIFFYSKTILGSEQHTTILQLFRQKLQLEFQSLTEHKDI